jgi:hypothetical protein
VSARFQGQMRIRTRLANASGSTPGFRKIPPLMTNSDGTRECLRIGKSPCCGPTRRTSAEARRVVGARSSFKVARPQYARPIATDAGILENLALDDQQLRAPRMSTFWKITLLWTNSSLKSAAISVICGCHHSPSHGGANQLVKLGKSLCRGMEHPARVLRPRAGCPCHVNWRTDRPSGRCRRHCKGRSPVKDHRVLWGSRR